MSASLCPVCNTELSEKQSYSLADVFKRWEVLHKFSDEVIQYHLEKSEIVTLFVCPKCLLEIFHPSVVGSASFYQELQDDLRVSYYQMDKWDFDEALRDAKNCNSLIEIGCGPGNFLLKAKRHVQKSCGTEYNTSALTVARNKGLEVYGSEDDLENMKGTFDALFSFHVLEHVADPVAFIQEISSLVRPNGKICISVPNNAGPVKFLGDNVMNMPPHHVTRWQKTTFEALAKRMDFRISRIAYEPLLLENHNYYSFYWLNTVLSNKTKFHRGIKKIILRFLIFFFDLLKKFGLKNFRFLRGQAIYVVMQKG